MRRAGKLAPTAAVVSVVLLASSLMFTDALTPPTLVNPIPVEDALPGGTGWDVKEPPRTEIEGYAELSVAPGDVLHVHVSSRSRYLIEVWRLGWYAGKGGRRVACHPTDCTTDHAAVSQPTPPAPDPSTGLVRAGWTTTDEIPIGVDWVSGYYLALLKLTSGPNAGVGYRVAFIVREPPGRRAPILVQASVNTWQAYNPWGGKSLNSHNSADGIPATHVSFERPLDHSAGNTTPLSHEIQLVRFLEREGFDVAYQTDLDTDRDPDSLWRTSLVVANGHPEYWTKNMRDAFDAARDEGQDLLFAGSGVSRWQVRYEDDRSTLVGYKSSADPIADRSVATIQFRALSPPRPECSLVGVQHAAEPETDAPTVVDGSAYIVDADPSTVAWFAGTGLAQGQQLPNLVGYEWDGEVPGCAPANQTRLFSAAGTEPAAAVTYVSPAGGRVLSWGSMYFKYGIDAYDAPGNVEAIPAVQAFTRNAVTDLGAAIDTVAPNTSFTSTPPTDSSGPVSFTFRSTEASVYQCRVNGGDWSPCTSPVTVPAGTGQRSVDVRATDLAGNQEHDPATQLWFT